VFFVPAVIVGDVSMSDSNRSAMGDVDNDDDDGDGDDGEDVAAFATHEVPDPPKMTMAAADAEVVAGMRRAN
jgi:hypothetical protein